MIYVIGIRGSSIAKVGFTSGTSAKRLKEIQVGNPVRLEVLWEGQGGRPLEESLHSAFKPYRIRGEWYDFRGLNPAEEVQAAVSSISQGAAPASPTQTGEDVSVQIVATIQLPRCVCGHKLAKHGVDGCTVVGYQEWEDCPCSVYASSALLEDIAPLTRVPIQSSRGDRATTDRQHRWHKAVHREAESARWPEGTRMLPAYWPEHLADLAVSRIVRCDDPGQYAGVVLDEVIQLRWLYAGPMVPGVYAERLTDRIVARLV